VHDDVVLLQVVLATRLACDDVLGVDLYPRGGGGLHCGLGRTSCHLTLRCGDIAEGGNLGREVWALALRHDEFAHALVNLTSANLFDHLPRFSELLAALMAAAAR
jgi:hypothetical protein